MNRSGGGYKVATAASSDTERVATGSSRSIGKMKVLGWDEDSVPVRATPVDQHMELSPQKSGSTTDAHTARELDNIYSIISQLQEGQVIHGNKVKGIDENIQQLSTRMDITENNVSEGIRQLSTRIDEAEKQRKADLKQHHQVERDHEFRHGVVVGMLTRHVGQVHQNAEPNGFSSPTPSQSDVSSDFRHVATHALEPE